jgi:hypothetical protein
MGCLIQSELK